MFYFSTVIVTIIIITSCTSKISKHLTELEFVNIVLFDVQPKYNLGIEFRTIVILLCIYYSNVFGMNSNKR